MKCKALFQIFIILTSIFTVSSLAPPAVEAQQQVCCQETTSGQHCQYTDSSNCKPGALQAAASCEQTSFCQLGCGFDSGTGRCFKNTPKATCQGQGNCTWTTSPGCEIPQCQRGCCVLSNQCSFVTQLQCKQITSQFPSINMTFDEGITSEFTCTNQCRSFERGACVQPDASCTFTTRAGCNVQTVPTSNTTVVGPKVGFYPDRLCSNPQLGTECAAQHTTGCLPDEDAVYWFDSCGNPENIYSSNRPASYNNGFVLSKEQSCNPSSNNINSETCGNCDFTMGTLCGQAPRNVQPTYGDYTCVDLSCNDLTVSATSPSSGTGTKKLGESWCAYDGAPGFGRDFAGSRHYRRLCINGQELTEPCKDFREEFCVQGVQGQPPLQTQESFELGGGNYVEALCRLNRHTTCVETENELDCENLQARDCYWVGPRVHGVRNGQAQVSSEPLLGEPEGTPTEIEKARRENEEGKCVPLVSPGLTFWPGESVTQTSGLDPKTTCDVGNQECTVTFQRPGIVGNPLGGNFGSRDWECVGNCQCLEKTYLQATNNVCKALGDCGAWYNIEGVFTEGGFVEDSDYDLLEEDVEPYDDLISPGGGSGDYGNKFNAFFKHAAPGLIISAATGVGTIIAFNTFGTLGIVEAFGRGALSGFNGVFGLEAFGEATWAEIGGRSFTTPIAQGAEMAAGTAFRAVAGSHTLPGATNVAFTSATGVTGNAVPLSSYLPTMEMTSVPGFPMGMPTPTGPPAVTPPAGLTVNPVPVSGGFEITLAEGTSLNGVTPPGSEVTLGKGMATTTTGWGTALQVLNTIAWIYTIYSLLDVLLSDTKTRVITVSCEPWQAPVGGADCDKCDEEGKECSEYRCRSLGQLCKLLNAGTEKEACINSNPNDATSPIISADPSALEKGYTLTESPGRGFTINEKITPFTAVSLGITTNEFAQCKYSENPSETYEQMANVFGSGVFEEEHKMTFGLSSILAQPQALQLTNGGQYTLYLRCQDGNGNTNDAPYYVKFGIQTGPDFTPPVIEATSITNGAYVPAGVNTTGLTIYTNEPSECNWDDVDVEYEKMANTFSCTQSQLPTSSIYYGLYDCTTILTGIRSNLVNNYYFRCKDQANNVNAESYLYSLIGTIPLSITSISPQPGTQFYIANPTLKVSTAQGAQNGVAVCGYSFLNSNPASAIEFLQTNATTHEQQFENLIPGSYTAYVTCADVAGNIDQGNTTFTISIDNQGPLITNLYTQGNILHLSTNEVATCEFSTTGSFSFGQGTPMTGAGTIEHETTLQSNIYYIVCEDQFTNVASYKIFI